MKSNTVLILTCIVWKDVCSPYLECRQFGLNLHRWHPCLPVQLPVRTYCCLTVVLLNVCVFQLWKVSMYQTGLSHIYKVAMKKVSTCHCVTLIIVRICKRSKGLFTPSENWSESEKDQRTSKKDQRINGKYQRKFILSHSLLARSEQSLKACLH